MSALFSAAVLLGLSFFYAPPGFAQGPALSGLDQSGSVNASVPVPPAPSAVAGTGAQEDMRLWNEYLSRNFGGGQARAQRLSEKGAHGEVVESVNLPPILNASFKSGLTFRTSANTVHISGAEALNCQDNGSCSSNDKYFLVFTTEKGQTLFVRAKDVANAMFVSGSKQISFAGDDEEYTVKLNVKLTNPGKSRLTLQGPSKVAIDVTLDDLTAALLKKARALGAGARHNLYYNTAIIQDPSGNGLFAQEKVLTFSPRGKDPNLTIRASQINSSGVLLPGVEKDLGFRIIDETLEIYKL